MSESGMRVLRKWRWIRKEITGKEPNWKEAKKWWRRLTPKQRAEVRATVEKWQKAADDLAEASTR